ANIRKETKRFTRFTQYFDALVGHHLAWSSADTLTHSELSPLAGPYQIFKPMQELAEQYADEIMLEKGRGEQYLEAERIFILLNRITDAFDNLEQVTTDGELQEMHAKGKLRCQQQLWRAAVDGVTGLAAWSYTL
ncbi:hypothetical protein MPER_16117, partial [Moniliophthora perniciosa FA553]